MYQSRWLDLKAKQELSIVLQQLKIFLSVRVNFMMIVAQEVELGIHIRKSRVRIPLNLVDFELLKLRSKKVIATKDRHPDLNSWNSVAKNPNSFHLKSLLASQKTNYREESIY